MSEPQIIELDFTDSTNNYAMRLIDGNKAQPGLTIVANGQTNGKGQRGKAWTDTPGQSLLMSIVVSPKHTLSEQFLFNTTVTLAIVNVLQKLDNDLNINIKWPNDIIVGDKKAGGILIENVLRGSKWTHSVIGLGLNILQDSFPADLPHATSLKIATGKSFDKAVILRAIRDAVCEAVPRPMPAYLLMQLYNGLLFRKGQKQTFSDASGMWKATILHANTDGTLAVQTENGAITNYLHGQAIWDYSNQDV